MNDEDTIGSYRLLSTLGRGGMGVVYLAEHQETGQRVALKTVRVESSRGLNANLLSSFRREIKALIRLRHPGVVRIVDEGVGHAGSLHQGLPWYAMEIIEGQELRHWMEKLRRGTGSGSNAPTLLENQTLPANEALERLLLEEEPLKKEEGAHPTEHTATHDTLLSVLDLSYQLCAPLAFLHGEGIVHKDLKPENILVRPDGTPVLVDFGLATQWGGESSRESFAVEVGFAGTASYVSPEQIQGEPLDARADLYSFGVMLYELCTGQKPFVGTKLSALLRAHLTEAPRVPSQLVPDLPPALDALILRLLAKSRRSRPGYAQDVALALAALCQERKAQKAESPAQGGEKRPVSVAPRNYLYRPSFSGRQELLQALHGALSELEAGGGGLLLLGGESGVGKTRLVMEMARDYARKGRPVLSGDCQDAVSKEALSAFQKPLQRIGDRCRERGQTFTEHVFGPRGKLLSLYEPSLAGLPGQEAYHPPAELPAQAAKLRLFAALWDVLSAYSEEAPLLLVLDDLQWADELSLGFLQFFLRSGSVSRALLVGTYRTEERAEGLDKLLSHSKAKRFSVGRLEEDAVAEMVAEMLALAKPPKLFSRFLAKQSEGNPFFVAEYLRTAVEEKLLWRDQEGSWQIGEEGSEGDYEGLGLPRSLRALVSHRLSGLSLEAKTQAEAVSISGREFSLSLWEQLSSATALDELLKKQILEEPAPGVLRFVHDKLREGLLLGIDPARAPALHRGAALALLNLKSKEEHLGALGYHWEQAGELEEARACYLSGARKAAGEYSYQEAERLYRAYLRLIKEPTEESINARNDLGETVLRVQGHRELAAIEHKRAHEEAISLRNQSAQARSLLRLGMARSQGSTEEAQVLHEQGLALAREAGNRQLEGSILGSLANLYRTSGRMEEAQSLYEQGLALTRETGEPRVEASILANLATLHYTQGRMEAARGFYEQALALIRVVGDKRVEGIILGNLANLHYTQNQMEAARGFYEQALALIRVVGDQGGEGIILANLAGLYQNQGRVEEARRLFGQALVILRKVGDQRIEGFVLGELSATERYIGNLAEGERFAALGEALLTESGDKNELGKLLCNRGHLLLAEAKSAKAHLARVQVLAEEVSARPESELGQKLTKLARAQTTFEDGQDHLLFRGERIEDIVVLIRKWLVETGQLSVERAGFAEEEQR